MQDPEPKSAWNQAKPATIPRPTGWPAAMAFAITLVFWSLITSPVIAVIGGASFIISLAGWIYEIRHERRAS